MEVLTQLFCERGVPVYLRSDTGSEFTARKVRPWLSRLEVRLLFIEPGSTWENGCIESFNGKMRDELLARQILIEMWRKEYNTVRPHSSLGYRPLAPEAIPIQPSQFQQVGLT
jgi:putative transposase